MTDPWGTPKPGGKVIDVVGWGKSPSWREGYLQPSNKIMSGLGAVDHLDEEAVGDCVKRLWDVHRRSSGNGLVWRFQNVIYASFLDPPDEKRKLYFKFPNFVPKSTEMKEELTSFLEDNSLI